jgi:hypothetical protein
MLLHSHNTAGDDQQGAVTCWGLNVHNNLSTTCGPVLLCTDMRLCLLPNTHHMRLPQPSPTTKNAAAGAAEGILPAPLLAHSVWQHMFGKLVDWGDMAISAPAVTAEHAATEANLNPSCLWLLTHAFSLLHAPSEVHPKPSMHPCGPTPRYGCCCLFVCCWPERWCSPTPSAPS